MPTLDIQHLGVRYATKNGTVDALSDINLAMRDGDFVVAIGASGCGKTTLLSCIAGFLPPTDGRLLLDGRPIAGPGAERGAPEGSDGVARVHEAAGREREERRGPQRSRGRARRSRSRR